MDAIMAYDSCDSSDEDVTSTETSSDLIKTTDKNSKTDCQDAKNTSLKSLGGQNQLNYGYSQFSSSLLPFSDHQNWIPSNLMSKLKNDTINSAPNLAVIGPQIPIENENSSSICKATYLSRPKPGPIKHQSVADSKKTSFKVRPYVSKREREKLRQTESKCVETTVISCVNDVNNITTDTKSDISVVNKPPKRVLYQFNGHSKCVNCIRWNPFKQNLLASASMDHTVGIWDTNRSGLCLNRLTLHEAAVKDVKWSTCGTKVLSCGFDKCAKLVDIETGELVQNFAHKQFVTCIQFHPNEPNLFLSGTSRNGIYCWDSRQQKVVSVFQAPFGQVQDIAFLPGGEEFISAAEVLRRNSTDKGIMVWDFRSTAIMSNQVYQEAFTCTCLKVHPSGSFFGAQSNADYIALFSTKRPYKLNKYKRYEGHQVSAYVIRFDFSPDGSLVASGSADGKMYIYNSQTSYNIASIPVYSSICMDASFHPYSPSTVATCSFDGQIAILA